MVKINLGRDFPTRVLTGLVVLPIALAAIFSGSPFFDLAMFVVALIAGSELHWMMRPATRLGLPANLAIIASFFAGSWLRMPTLPVLALLLSLIAGLAETGLAPAPRLPFFERHVFFPLLGALYVGLPTSLMLLIRARPDGLAWIMALILNNWMTDSFALIGGRLAGHTKLAPRISPNKTVEGALIGLCGGFIAGMIIAAIGKLPLAAALAANAVVACLTVVGDLVESWLKRTFHVKNSGWILPGHGGLLDRVDGLLLAVPGAYLVMLLLL